MSNGLQLRTLQQMLEAQGLDMSALTDPGAQYGYGAGTPYGFMFQPFDIARYQESAQALLGLEESLMGGVQEQFVSGGKQLRTGLGTELQKIAQMGRPSGLIGGAEERLQSYARRGATEAYGELTEKTEQKKLATQEQLGRQAAQLEGSFTSFLGDTVTRYLQLLQADPNEPTPINTFGGYSQGIGTINLPDFSSLLNINYGTDIYGGNQSG
jgi:hypothetical protein